MAILQVLGSDKTLRINDTDVLGLVQNFNWAPNFNAQDVNELGDTKRVDTLMELETSGSFEIMSAGNLAGVLARMRIKYNTGTGAFEGFTYDPVASGASLGVNGYEFTQDDLDKLKFDAILHEKPDQNEFSRSTYLACCYPTSISGRVDANGLATDTINWAGLYVVGFPAPYHDIRSAPLTYASGTTLTSPTAYNSTDYELAYVTIDSRPIRFVNTDPAKVTAFATNTITVSGIAVTPESVCMGVFYAKTPETDWTNVHTPERMGVDPNAVYGVRGFQANVYIAPADADTPVGSEQWLRVQSIDYNIDLRSEALRQIAQNLQGTSIYHRAVTFPLNMTVNATVAESDWADWKAVMTKAFDGSDVYEDVYEFSPQYMKKSFAVVIEYFTKDGTKIQDLSFRDLRVDGMGSRVNVGGRSEVTWSFTGTEMQLTGINL